MSGCHDQALLVRAYRKTRVNLLTHTTRIQCIAGFQQYTCGYNHYTMSPDHPKSANEHPRIILASGSPRRAELMREYGYDIEVMIPTVDESDMVDSLLPPAQQAMALSYFKARNVMENVDQGWVIGGDTIASLDGCVFGKPVDRSHAKKILTTLLGTTHEVITGVTLLDASSQNRLVQHDTTRVTMKSISEEKLEQYLDTHAWQGKAGAYGIQDQGDEFVEKIEGSFSNVVGFPMELIRQMLAQWGWQE